jgi:O-acetyl-ADP-ribose deacetylase (regulator of RNase III)
MPKIVKGDLIQMALNGEFEAIAHGCNCFCTMGAGIALSMKKTFGCDEYNLEDSKFSGSYLKMGNIQYKTFFVKNGVISTEGTPLKVYNIYTQYAPGVSLPPYDIPFDYDAFRLCIRKLLYTNKKSKIGLPWIGCGLGKAEKSKVKEIIEQEERGFKGEVWIVEL